MFIPNDLRVIVTMLQGLSAGIVYVANLILIKSYVNSKLRQNAVTLSCVFRLTSVIVMPQIKEDLDEFYQGIILIIIGALSGIIIVFCDIKKSKDRVWDEYYESYFERQSKLTDEDNSLCGQIIYFFGMFGMRLPGLLLNNSGTKGIQLSFLENFSHTFASFYFITIVICILILAVTAFNPPSTRNPSSMKFVLIPGAYIMVIFIVINVPLIYVYLQQRVGGISLMAIILINFLLDIAFNAGIFHLLDTVLVKSDLSNYKIGILIALEVFLLAIIERGFFQAHVLEIITIPGYYVILAILSLVPLYLYHKKMEDI